MNAGRILIADDSMVVRMVIRKQLAPDAFELAEVGSGEEVLAYCRADAPDVVLLDVEMPGMSGYQVLTEMQADPALADIPVVILSGRVSTEDVAMGLRMGAHDYLRKPVESGELLARVTAAIRTKRRHEELARSVDQLKKVAPVDPATGMLDAKALADRIRAWADGDDAADRALSGVLLVLDGLEQVGERHGPAAVEEVVVKIADAVAADLRGADVVGRCGPAELLALLPGTKLESARAVSRRLRQIAESTPVVLGAELVTMTMAIGVAETVDGDQHAFVRDLQQSVDDDRTGRTMLGHDDGAAKRWKFFGAK